MRPYRLSSILKKERKKISMLEKDIQEILFTEEQLKNRVNEIARQIEADYAGK